MPTWSFEPLKLFRSRTESRPAAHTPNLSDSSINIRVHTQRSQFPEPPRTPPKSNHRSQHDPTYGGVQPSRKQKPRPLSISYSLPCLPYVAVQDPEPLDGPGSPTDLNSLGINAHAPDDKSEQNAEAKRARRHGILNYPDDVREGLRKVQSKPKLCAAPDEKRPSRYPFMHGVVSPSVYSDTSSHGARIRVSSPRVDNVVFEPPWFSDQSTSDSEATSRYLSGLSDFESEYLRQLMAPGPRDNPAHPSRAGPSDRGSRARVNSTQSWETFEEPSLPPSPSDSDPPRQVPPRDPRLPPADYFLHKEVYDDAAIARFGALPAEWVQYVSAYRHNRV